MKILSNKKYNELILKSCEGMFGAVTDDMLLRENALLNEENKQLKEDKKKAIEYIKNYDIFKEFSFPLMKRDEENQVKSSIDYQFKNDLYRNLLILLGDKE